jgi:hypothetical protein
MLPTLPEEVRNDHGGGIPVSLLIFPIFTAEVSARPSKHDIVNGSCINLQPGMTNLVCLVVSVVGGALRGALSVSILRKKPL